MRPRRSFSGPVLLIAAGVVLLINAISPNVRILDALASYWPFILIGWGLLQIVEILLRYTQSSSVRVRTMAGGSWALVFLIAAGGLALQQARRAAPWWHGGGWMRGVEAFGHEHQFSFDAMARPAGRAPRVVIETFRGDAKIMGGPGTEVTVTGRKLIRAFDDADAARADKVTPVELITQGDAIVVRCRQDTHGERSQVSSDLEIHVPSGASIEATGIVGDFDINGVSGTVDISSQNAGIRLEDLGGNVKIETGRSDLIRCVNVRGSLDLRGHGEDLELNRIAGDVRIAGDYRGSVSLREVSHPVRMENLRTECDLRQVAGELRMERGSLSLENVVGPLKLNTRATDVKLSNFSGQVELSVDRGDVELRPGRLPLAPIAVESHGGDIELELPGSAGFTINAATAHGEIENDFESGLHEEKAGSGARLTGTMGSAADQPEVKLKTAHGHITIRKSGNGTEGGETRARL